MDNAFIRQQIFNASKWNTRLFAFYFSKEGRDERGRGLIATASLIAFVALFFLLNIVANNLSWLMDNHVRLMNGLQLSYTLFLFIADIALLILRKIK